MAASLSIWQRLLSFLYPVSIRKGSSAHNPVLELFFFQGRYILSTKDAIYSDGEKYRPLLTAFSTPRLKAALPAIKNVLVLGTGLASAAHILAGKGFLPKMTLVEIDELVLAWAMEFLPSSLAGKVRAIEGSAFDVVSEDGDCYDLIIVDIFFGRTVPDAVLAGDFLTQCHARLMPGGFLVLNYMEYAGEPQELAGDCLKQLFSEVQKVSFGINKVYVAYT